MNLRLLVLIIFSIISAGTFTLLEYSSRSAQVESWEKVSNIQEVRSNIVLQDEVLTDSANMMALTGDEAWINRYYASEVQLSLAIEEISKLLPAIIVARTVKITEEANNVLVEMEKKSFELSRQGMTEQAYKYLNSKEYLNEKKNYIAGMDLLIHEIKKMEEGIKNDNKKLSLIVSLSQTALFLLAIVVWIFFYRREKRDDLNKIQDIRNILDTTLNNLPALVWAKDLEGNFLFINKKFSKIANVDPYEIIGNTDYYWAPKHLADGYVQDDKWVIENGKNIEREETVPDVDGVEKDHTTVKFPLYDAKNKIVGAGGFSFDISDIRQKEKELDYHKSNLEKLVKSQTRDLEQAKEQLDVMIENSPGMIYRFEKRPDYSMHFPYVSAKAFDIFEIDQKEYDSDSAIMLELVEPDFVDDLLKKIIESSNNMSKFEWTGKILTKKAKSKWIKASSVPRRVASGSVIWDGIIIDVTKEKIIEAELARQYDIAREKSELLANQADDLIGAKEEAIAANKAKSLFLANISHEIRTPMHGVLSFAEIGIEKSHSAEREELKDYFIEVEETGKRLLSLLNDLLDLSKLEAGKEKYNIQKENLSTIISSALSQFNQLARSKELKIESNIKPESFDFECDEQKIHQVFSNLISNAIKFSYEKTSIHIRCEKTDDKITISVENEGVGIPARELNEVFDKFTQSSRTKTNAGGTGLGLSICKKIIEDHNGTIWAENDGKYVRFLISMPIRQPQVRAA